MQQTYPNCLFQYLFRLCLFTNSHTILTHAACMLCSIQYSRLPIRPEYDSLSVVGGRHPRRDAAPVFGLVGREAVGHVPVVGDAVDHRVGGRGAAGVLQTAPPSAAAVTPSASVDGRRSRNGPEPQRMRRHVDQALDRAGVAGAHAPSISARFRLDEAKPLSVVGYGERPLHSLGECGGGPARTSIAVEGVAPQEGEGVRLQVVQARPRAFAPVVGLVQAGGAEDLGVDPIDGGGGNIFGRHVRLGRRGVPPVLPDDVPGGGLQKQPRVRLTSGSAPDCGAAPPKDGRFQQFQSRRRTAGPAGSIRRNMPRTRWAPRSRPIPAPRRP
mmetsp:Transcript_11659/g.24872  ORF Transcript_11659/g.24872 Transcript_11659/m.24872 type:complete len:327 (+) Transcript_11659:416-1396(+)